MYLYLSALFGFCPSCELKFYVLKKSCYKCNCMILWISFLDKRIWNRIWLSNYLRIFVYAEHIFSNIHVPTFELIVRKQLTKISGIQVVHDTMPCSNNTVIGHIVVWAMSGVTSLVTYIILCTNIFQAIPLWIWMVLTLLIFLR